MKRPQRNSFLNFEILEHRTLLAIGEIDPTFGQNGVLRTDFGDAAAPSSQALDVLVQTDGKIVAATESVLLRYTRSGAVDTTFGELGSVATPFYVRSVAAQSDGSLIVAGSNTESIGRDYLVARYTPLGELDSTFGEQGVAAINFGSQQEFARAVEVDWADRIVVAGSADSQVGVARLLRDGQLDNRFAGDGTMVRGFRYEESVQSLALQSNGSILVAGISTAVGPSQDLFVARINPNGTIDNNFGEHGMRIVDFSTSRPGVEEGGDVTLQPDGRIVLSCALGGDYAGVVRLNVDGSFDNTFSRDGVADYRIPVRSIVKAKVLPSGRILVMAHSGLLRTFANGDLDSAYVTDKPWAFVASALAIQADVKPILVGGFNGSVSIRRLSVLGADDVSFGTAGYVTTPLAFVQDKPSDSVVLPSGKFIMAGMDTEFIYVSQYTPDGQLDTAFSDDGRQMIRLLDRNRIAPGVNLAVAPDGKLVIATTVEFYPNDRQAMVIRLTATGELDTSFSDDGMTWQDFGTEYDYASDVVVQQDGKIVIGAGSRRNFLRKAYVVRFNTDGSLDSSYGTDGIYTFGSTGVFLTHLALQSDGKVVVCGYTISNFTALIYLVRMLTSGRPDGTFGVNGRVNTAAVGVVSSLVLAADDSFYVSGNSGLIAHFLANGALDTSFSFLGAPGSLTAFAIKPDGQFLYASDIPGDASLVVATNADGTPEQSFYGNGTWNGPLPGQNDAREIPGADRVRFTQFHLLPNGRILGIGKVARTTRWGEDNDFIAVRFSNVTPSAVTTTVALNASGQIDIVDRWSHNNDWLIGNTETALVLTEQSSDPRVKFTVQNLPEISGNGTKQISIPWSLLRRLGKPLIFNAMGGDDSINFASDTFNAPTFGMSLRGGQGVDTLGISAFTVPVSWIFSSGLAGSLRPQGRVPMTFSDFDQLNGSRGNDHFQLFHDRVESLLGLFGSEGLNSAEIRADEDVLHYGSELTIGSDRHQRFVQGNIINLEINTGDSDNNIYVNQQSYGFGSVTIRSGAGNDTIEATSIGNRASMLIDAGSGDDIVRVGNSGSRVYGGNGNDIITTAAAPHVFDRLFGDAGRDILVGGMGQDILYGGAGEDILIGGYCAILSDLNQDIQRRDILRAWSANTPFALRVQQLSQMGIGPAGTTKLTDNVSDDTAVDTFFGGQDQDWFFVDELTESLGGSLRDLQANEVLTFV